MISKYNEAFKQNKPLIEQLDFLNHHNNVLHDNLGIKLISENIKEYRINIDSKDRDNIIYPNPFKYTVNFGPASGQTITNYDWIDPNNKKLGKMPVKQFISGVPNPCVNRAFRNVKYIRIDNIILPRHYKIDGTSPNYTIDTTTTLDNDIFLILNIPELPTNNVLGTNGLNEKGHTIYPDNIRDNYFTCITRHIGIVYDDNMLGNITKLTFEFFDSNGNLLNLLMTEPTEKLINDTQTKTELNNTFNDLYQNHITIIIGVVENDLTTNTKYER